MQNACVTTSHTTSNSNSSFVTSANLLSYNTSEASLFNPSSAPVCYLPNITVPSTIPSSFSNIPSNTNSRTSLLSDCQKSVSLIPSGTPNPVLSQVGKIIGRNANGTTISTSSPNNAVELQLYRVLQRASLLLYYDTLLAMGGDDVQQLCDAGEEEFLEIMALVGMASKPLHVRRLQKVLHEWSTNPSLFQTPLTTSGILEFGNSVHTSDPSKPKLNLSISPGFPIPFINTVVTSSISNINNSRPSLTSLATSLVSQVSSSSSQLTPILNEVQISKIGQIAEKMAQQLPQKEPKQLGSKKRMSKELEQVMVMDENDPRRMDEIRKYAAIYGRFDCKRRPEKPLTMHELYVNEAAAQICKFIPALLTRRDELFPLARQLVKDAELGNSASFTKFLEHQQQKLDDSVEISSAKRVRLLFTEISELNKEEYRVLLLWATGNQTIAVGNPWLALS